MNLSNRTYLSPGSDLPRFSIRLIVGFACCLATCFSTLGAIAQESPAPVSGLEQAQRASVPPIAAGARRLIPELCWAEGTDPKLMQSRTSQTFFERLVTSLEPPTEQATARFQFADTDRWSTTANDSGLGQGDPMTLTWSIVPDGTSIFGYNGEATADSDLRAFLDGIYGSSATWLPLFEQVFERWGELTGITYLYEPNDDGSDWTEFSIASGQSGVRGDVRISGHLIDGNSNVLAYNFFPDFGDMVIDTGDNTYSNTNGNSLILRNVLAHEHGHGLGLSHVCPVNQSKLMEPFLSTAFDGPQQDDILATQRGYGDDDEPSDSAAQAQALGTLSSSLTRDGISIDDGSDLDVYSFTITTATSTTIEVTPIGSTYLSGPQNGNGTCSAGSSFNSLDNQNLSIEVLAGDGATVLASSDSSGAGAAEVLSDLLLSSAGTYYARISGPANEAQLYELEVQGQAAAVTTVELQGTGTGTVTSTPAGISCPGDCDEAFAASTVDLLPAAAGGSEFVGWSGDGDCADGTVSTTTSKTCVATFNLQAPGNVLSITRSGAGTGTVTSDPVGIDCGSDCSEEYSAGQVVSLQATPATGSQFAGWSGDADCSDGTVTMNGARSCVATFDLVASNYQLTVSKSGSGSGTVTSSPPGINCGADCSQVYSAGTTVTLNASAIGASVFSGWSGDVDCLDGVVEMDSNLTCTATFATQTRTLTLQVLGSGQGSVVSSPSGISCPGDCAGAYELGSTVSLLPSPASGSTFFGFSGSPDCSDGVVTVNSNLACVAVFALEPALHEDDFESADTTSWSLEVP